MENMHSDLKMKGLSALSQRSLSELFCKEFMMLFLILWTKNTAVWRVRKGHKSEI